MAKKLRNSKMRDVREREREKKNGGEERREKRERGGENAKMLFPLKKQIIASFVMQCNSKWEVFVSECEAETNELGHCPEKCRRHLNATLNTQHGATFATCETLRGGGEETMAHSEQCV